MENGIFSQEKSYWSREVAELLSISDSTLRKYCLILEQNGYIFLRDDNNRRGFIERDVTALRQYLEVAKNSNMTLEDAALSVISAIKENEITDMVPFTPDSNQIHPYNQRYDELVGQLQQLVEQSRNQQTFNRILLNRLEKQEIFIQEILKETQVQLVATQEEEILLERQRRITNMITQKRVEAKLEMEALELWKQKPASERMKKVGFFRKKEDKDKKEHFIRFYINSHFEERLKEEYKVGHLL